MIKLHFLADRYSVNALQRRIEERLATYGTSADRGPSFHVLEFLYSNLDGKKSKLRHFIPEYIIYTVDEVTMYESLCGEYFAIRELLLDLALAFQGVELEKRLNDLNNNICFFGPKHVDLVFLDC